MNKNHDITFIGTVPINLLKAYLLLKENPALSVLFIDERENSGGAWFSDKSVSGFEIETIKIYLSMLKSN